MLRVIKPENVKNVSEPVKIPDAVIIKKPKLKSFEDDINDAKLNLEEMDGDNVEKLEKYLSDSKKEMLEEVNREYEKVSQESKQLM